MDERLQKHAAGVDSNRDSCATGEPYSTRRQDDKSVTETQGETTAGKRKYDVVIQIKHSTTENAEREEKHSGKCAATKSEDQAGRGRSKESVLPIHWPLIRRMDMETGQEGNDKPCCRICFRGSSEEPLFSPCECKGTMAYIHRCCLERWLSSRGTEVCELCRFHFITSRTPQGFWEWCRHPENAVDRRNILGDIVCFILLTPIGLTSLWLCIQGANHYRRYYGSSWETAALAVLSVFLVLGYMIWIILSFRYHYAVWQRWRTRHFNVHLIITNDEHVSEGQSSEMVTASECNTTSDSSSSTTAEVPDEDCDEPRPSNHKLIS